MYMHSKILVTGGSGFVGVNLIHRLINLGAQVRATLFNHKAIIEDNQIEYVRCDLRNPIDCHKVVNGIDYIFHSCYKTGLRIHKIDRDANGDMISISEIGFFDTVQGFG